MLSRTFTLGRYTCVERIGASPLGEQWRAKRFGLTGVERLYLALKLHPQLTGDPGATARLAAAAKAYAELDSEGVLRLVEHGSQGADHFVIYEFVGHADLRRLKAGLDLSGGSGGPGVNDRRSLLPALVAGIGLSLSATLATAHKKGVVHGLLAPQSVWIDGQGGVRLGDLGLWRLVPKAGWSGDERIKPWLPYLAPEVTAGGEPTPASDVFALGALLSELLGPAAGDPSDVERALRPILDRAQRKAAAERFADAEALHKELTAITLPMTADAVGETLAQVGKQFMVVGDSVPQPVVISERSSAEPLPPPPSLRTGKVSLSGVSKGARGSRKDGVSLLGDEAVRTVAGGRAAGRPPRAQTPPPPAPADAPRRTTGENKRPSGAQRAASKSGIDWLNSTDPGQGGAAGDGAEPAEGPGAERASGVRPATRRGVGPVSVNPRAQFGKGPAPSTATPTQDLDAATAAATLAAEQLRQQQQQQQPAPAAPAIDVGLYAPLVSGSSSLERDPYDSLGTGETNPSLAPVRTRSISQPSHAVGDEATNEVSLTDIAAAEADALNRDARAQSQAGVAPVGEPAPSSVSGYPDAMSPSGDVLASGVGLRERPRARTPLLVAGGAFFLLVAAVAYKLTAGSPTGSGSLGADAGARDAGRPVDTDPGLKAAAAGELSIESTPVAYLYIDAKPRGKTPTMVQIGSGAHKLLLIASGHKLLRQDVSAGAPLKLKLEPAILPAGTGGEQVVKIKCQSKAKGQAAAELRILVDGNDTGLGCPTEELRLSPGKHTLGFLNPLTEVLTDKPVKVKAGKKDTKVKVKVP